MAYFAVRPVVYLVAWILLHVKGARENRAFIYSLYAMESMLNRYPLAGSDPQNRCGGIFGGRPHKRYTNSLDYIN